MRDEKLSRPNEPKKSSPGLALAIYPFVISFKTNRLQKISPFCSIYRNRLSQVTEATTIGEHIRKKRCSDGLTQEALAKLLKVNRTTLSHWERGVERPSQLRPAVVAWLGFDPDLPQS
jgi:DNA-binding XRE family transcriptional regulator